MTSDAATACKPSVHFSKPSESVAPFRTSSAVTNYTNNNPFSFDGKTSFNAREDLSRTRSLNFHIRPAPIDDDVWKIPPPDFRPQNSAPKPPKRNSRESMQPWKYGTHPGHNERNTKQDKVFLLHSLQLPSKKEERRDEPVEFVTRFKRAKESLVSQI